MFVVGLVVIVEVCLGDNLVIYVVMVVVQFGDVLVVDGKGDLSCVLLGEIMVIQVQVSGIVGIIIDGVVCDVDILSKGNYFVFFVGLNFCGLIKFIFGWVNYFIFVVGVIVYVGDLVVVDIDGVVVILCEEVKQIISLVKGKLEMEIKCFVVICEGDLCLYWFNDVLCKVGMLVDGEML